jgi:hypothetical protein
MKKIIACVSLIILTVSCVSTRSSIKNIDNNAPIPAITNNNTFLITDYSKDKKYGYDPDYPINVFYQSTRNETINQERFLNALAGPTNEKITFKKVESCCPFPTKTSDMGAGFLDVYEVVWKGQKKPVRLYINIYERGALLVPVGLTIKK